MCSTTEEVTGGQARTGDGRNNLYQIYILEKQSKGLGDGLEDKEARTTLDFDLDFFKFDLDFDLDFDQHNCVGGCVILKYGDN